MAGNDWRLLQTKTASLFREGLDVVLVYGELVGDLMKGGADWVAAYMENGLPVGEAAASKVDR